MNTTYIRWILIYDIVPDTPASCTIEDVELCIAGIKTCVRTVNGACPVLVILS